MRQSHAEHLKDQKDLKNDTKLMNTLRSAVKAAEDEDGWARLGPVGSHISNLGPFDHRTYGFRKLSDLFDAIDLFEVKKEMNGSQSIVCVRIKKVGRRRTAAKKADATDS